MKLYGSLHDVMVAASAAMTTRASSVHTEKWQGKEVGDIPAAGMMEVLDFDFKVSMPQTREELERMVKPNMPWAEDHFQERIAGKPLNPGEQWKFWPWANSADTFRQHTTNGPLLPDRTWAYMAGLVDGEGTIYINPNREGQYAIRIYQKERLLLDHILKLIKVGQVYDLGKDRYTFLPNGQSTKNPMHSWQINRDADARWFLNGILPYLITKKEKALELLDILMLKKEINSEEKYKVWGKVWTEPFTHTYMSRFWAKYADNGETFRGHRYEYGDLDDVIKLLHEQPMTRQAFLPVFFPEDTGALHGGRIPCTIGYHFMRRGTGFHMWYWIRSCDYYRHFRDDVYMAVRLADYILGRLVNLDEENWRDIHLGMMHMDVASLHLFINDYRKLFGDQKWK